MRNKLQKEVVEDFIQWAAEKIERDKSTASGKRVREKAKEREWALRLICEKADMTDVLDKIKEETV